MVTASSAAVKVMWRNRISEIDFRSPSRLDRFVTSVPAACAAGGLTHAPGAFVATPNGGFQPDLYEIARQQAVYEIKKRRRTAFRGMN